MTESKAPRLIGKIKFWNEKKGYGFIENGDKQDIYLDGWDVKDGSTPKPGKLYEFEAEPAEKGIRARKAREVKREKPKRNTFTGPMDHNY